MLYPKGTASGALVCLLLIFLLYTMLVWCSLVHSVLLCSFVVFRNVWSGIATWTASGAFVCLLLIFILYVMQSWTTLSSEGISGSRLLCIDWYARYLVRIKLHSYHLWCNWAFVGHLRRWPAFTWIRWCPCSLPLRRWAVSLWSGWCPCTSPLRRCSRCCSSPISCKGFGSRSEGDFSLFLCFFFLQS